jgi:conjugal transfer pilus assembly protein TraD
VRLPLAHAEGHLLVVGTTGAGKTRLFDLLVTQAVLRGEAVVIIDPKGDQDLRNAAEHACRSAKAPERFVHFHPAFPQDALASASSTGSRGASRLFRERPTTAR